MIERLSCLLVRRNEEIAGGIAAAMHAMRSSDMTPGPLGISETRPSADAPYWIAVLASSTLAIQQILTLGLTAILKLERSRR